MSPGETCHCQVKVHDVVKSQISCCPITCFVASALASSSKVKGFPHCQLWQVRACLVDVGSRSLWDELLEAVPIVGDLAVCLHSSVG